MFFPRRLATFLAVTTVAAGCSDVPTTPISESPDSPDFQLVRVTSGDALKAALERASSDPRVRRIALEGDVALTEPLYYDSPLPLRIDGQGYTLNGPIIDIDAPVLPGDRFGEPSGGDALVLLGGGNVHIEDLTISGASGNGVYMEVPASARGMVRVVFDHVQLADNGLSGAWIEEQDNAAGPIASPAGIFVSFLGSSVTGNGFGGDGEAFADFDGIRVNEGGDGSIRFRVKDSSFDGNAGDGIELDETGAGNVRADVEDATFDANGAQPQFPDDLEDGFDIDEAGDGDVVVAMRRVSTNDSFDEGIDLDEEGFGDVVVRLEDVEANRNSDENIKVSEDAELEDVASPFTGGGSIRFRFLRVTANESADDGVQLEEFGPGDLRGVIQESVVTGNGDDGLDLTQAADGEGLVTVRTSDISGNADDDVNTDGVTVRTDG